MNKKEKCLILICIFGLIILTLYNIFCNQDFFIAPITSIVSIAIALLVAYYFVQMRTDERKQKEVVEKIIEQIRIFALDRETTHWPDSYDGKYTLLRIRRIRNKIDILCKYSKQFSYETEIEEIKNNFEKYEEAVDAHQNDIAHLKQCACDFSKWMDNINNRCDEIVYKLYSAQNIK